ncbi:MAG: aldehyde dehydrogenase family protein [Phycisphaerales bacterium]
MTDRLAVAKTYKLYINGAFPRSESGRADPVKDKGGTLLGHASKASRKDLRDAVLAARSGLAKWKAATPYLRAQILYRMAEMLEAKRAEFEALLEGTEAQGHEGTRTAGAEVAAAVDRLVAFAGWADKYTHVLGCQNAVSAPYWNITVPEPTGVIGIVCPAEHPLLALVSLVAPVICSGNACVVISGASAPVVSTFGEVCATGDLPAGVVNLLTGSTAELVPVLAQHRDVDGIHAAGLSPELARACREGTADNLKRVKLRDGVDWFEAAACGSPWWIEPFVEMKTVWHPIGT